MHAFFAALPALIILVVSIVDLLRKSKKAAAQTKAAAVAPQPGRINAPPVKRPIQTGYAGRRAQADLPEHARAMDSAGSRLASGAEYPSIVADRAADRASEARFAAQVQELEASEPKPLSPLQLPQQKGDKLSPIDDLQRKIAQSTSSGTSVLVTAFILSEVISEPRCKRKSKAGYNYHN